MTEVGRCNEDLDDLGKLAVSERSKRRRAMIGAWSRHNNAFETEGSVDGNLLRSGLICEEVVSITTDPGSSGVVRQ